MRMADLDREVIINAGRRDGDGRLRLSIFAEDLLAVTLEGHGERAPTLLLTAEQAAGLRDALSQLLPLLGGRPAAATPEPAAAWQGGERRRRTRSG